MLNRLLRLFPLSFLFLLPQVTTAQIYQSYVLDTNIAYRWEDFDANLLPTEILALAGEDEVYAIQLPFPFRFFDSTWTTAFVGLNGYVSFGRNYHESDFNREHLCFPVTQFYNPQGEQNSLNPDNFIGAYWDDLFLDGTCTPADGGMPKLAYRVKGTAPNRELIIVWDYMVLSADLAPCATSSPAYSGLLNVQLRLLEGSNNIEVHIRSNYLSAQAATIAVENAAGDYAVYANCGEGNSPGSDTVAFRFIPSTNPPVTGPKTYCQANGADCVADDRYIVDVQLANLKNSSNCSDSGYTDFTTKVANLIRGQSYQMVVQTNAFGVPGGANNKCYAWIDWNRDTVFDLTTEAVQLQGNGSQGTVGFNGIFAGVVTVPETAAEGITRMRVRHTFVLNNTTPCGSDNLGEVEDYHVAIDVPLTGYCEAKGGDCSLPPDDPANPNTDPDYDRIDSVAITTDNGTIINQSGCNRGYGNFTANTSLWARWTVETSYTVAVRREIFYIFGQQALWVDWNNDFDFDDPGEAYTGAYNSSTGTTIFAVVAPPGTAQGLKRMRIRTTNAPNVPYPCGEQLNGEVEDYTIVLSDPALNTPDCPATTYPASNAANVCQEVTLQWSLSAGADGYRVNFSRVNPDVIIIVDSVVSDTFLVLPAQLDTNATYKWIVTPFNEDGDALGCDTLGFTTSPDLDPVADILPSFDTILQCKDNALRLSGNPAGGTAPLTHNWTGDSISLLDDPNVVDPEFAGAESGSYTYTYVVRDAKGCTGTDRVKISIIEEVVAGNLAAADDKLCDGEAATLIHSGSFGNIIFQDSLTGQPWSNVTLNDLGNGRYLTGPLSTSTYFRAIATAGSCADTSDQLLVSVNPIPAAPLIVAGGNTTFCENSSVLLYTTNYSSGITWNDPGETANDTVVISMAGSFEATYTDNFGCFATSAPITTSAIAAPNKPQIQVLGDAETCIGDTLQLFVNNPNNDSIVWNDNNSTNNDSLRIFSPGNYIATAYNSLGCSTASDALLLLFDYKPPKPVISRVGPEQLCNGDILLLISDYKQGIVWNTGSTNDTIVVTQSGIYNVTYTTPNGCSSTSGNINANFGTKPSQPSILVQGDTLVSSVEGYSYQWIGPNGPISGANERSYRPTATGEYRVVVFTFEGCRSDQSATYFYDATGILAVGLQGISIYPNPATEKFVILIENAEIQNYTVILNDIWGREVFRKTSDNRKLEIEVKEFKSGTYVVKLLSGDNWMVRPLIFVNQ